MPQYSRCLLLASAIALLATALPSGLRAQDYRTARAAFEQEAGLYWEAIAEKRRTRNAKRRERIPVTLDDYVLEQPPQYDGPPRPAEPPPPADPSKPRRSIPVAADFLKAAAEHFGFRPERVAESDFKRAYAREALASGLTREQAVRVYAFETGGNGGYNLQSGLSSGRPNARAISTAMGYNQLLGTNSVNLIAEQGSHFIKVLGERASRLSGPRRTAVEHKLAVLKRMHAFSRTVPNNWGEQEKLARTPQGWAVHALVFDIDIGPMLQTHKLLTSVAFARSKGYTRPLTAAELEMMNLTGDSTGLDMVTMPQAMRDRVPTANFFQRGGYERNPVAIRHNTVAKLLAVTDARMDSNSNLPGARDLAAALASSLAARE